MTFDIPSEFEPVIAQAVTAGLYPSRDEAIRHALELFVREQKLSAIERMSSTGSAPTSDHDEQNPPGLDGTIPDSIDVDAYVRRHGAAAISDTEDLKADFWPDGLSVEEFLQPIYAQRQQDAQRGSE